MSDQPSNKPSFQGHEGVQQRLRVLREYYELSWPVIAALSEFQGIPPATLQRIKQTGVVPKKHRDKFEGVGAVDNRNRGAVNFDNMQSTANTLNKNIDTGKLTLLINHLSDRLRIRKEINNE